MIYLPADGRPSHGTWHSNDDCVWSGPEWLTAKQPLNLVYKDLEEFFRLTLKIRDFQWRDCLLELIRIKSDQAKQPLKVAEIYHRLMLDFAHHRNWDELR